MKLEDIIDYDLSYWNVLGQTGGTALPDNDKSVNVNGIAVWKKNPPHRTGKNKKRINEVQRGPDYDWANDDGAEEFNPGTDGDENPKYGGWASDSRAGDYVMSTGEGGRRKKIIIRRVGKHSIETIDDEGNRQLKGVTGNIKSGPHLSGRRTSGGELPESKIIETQAGAPSGASATQAPVSGPSELEYDLSRVNVKKEFKGKDTRADIKTSKKKKESLKKYLARRTAGEIIGN